MKNKRPNATIIRRILRWRKNGCRPQNLAALELRYKNWIEKNSDWMQTYEKKPSGSLRG